MKKVVIFSGAGMSAESGISTFRDSGGLWDQYDIKDVATPEAWMKNAELVQAFYNERRKQILSVEPNKAHFLIARLEKNFDVQVITQNIDDLHERAGSTKVLHLHGNIRFAKSSGTINKDKLYHVEGDEIKMGERCEHGYQLRPHVVWFGEEVPELYNASQLISTADTLIIIGTSLNVYPAAGLIHAARANCNTWLIDPNANSIQVPNNIKSIEKTASEGLQHLMERNLI